MSPYVVRVPLSNGGFAVVDSADADAILKFTWRRMRTKKSRVTYAVTSLPRTETGRRPALLMHRLILGARRGTVVDHKNRDGLDNRRQNLRACSHSLNLANAIVHRTNNTSGFKGVCRTRSGRWQATIQYRGRQRRLGTYASREEAAAAYRKAALRTFGAFARVD